MPAPHKRRLQLRAVLATAAAAAVLGGGAPASAHPHIWIEAGAVLFARDGAVHEIRQVWQFDPLFSGMIAADFDLDRNGRLDAEELKALAETSLQSLREYGYFTHLLIGGERLTAETVKDFRVQLKDGIVYYLFTVPLPEPIDPAGTRFAFSLYDHSYYTDVSIEAATAVKLAGDWPAGCAVRAEEDRGNPIYFGMVFPQRVAIACPGS